jgi:hypothetical protein
MSFVHNGKGPAKGPPKDPDETLWYGVVWDDEAQGASISRSEWIVDPGLTVVSSIGSETVTIDGVTYTQVNKVLLKGGVVGQVYQVTNRATFNNQTMDRSFKIAVVEK